MTTKTKHLLYRHIPSIIIVLLFIFVLIQSIFIDNFGNTYFSEIKTASNKEQIEAITHLKNQFIA